MCEGERVCVSVIDRERDSVSVREREAWSGVSKARRDTSRMKRRVLITASDAHADPCSVVGLLITVFVKEDLTLSLARFQFLSFGVSRASMSTVSDFGFSVSGVWFQVPSFGFRVPKRRVLITASDAHAEPCSVLRFIV